MLSKKKGDGTREDAINETLAFLENINRTTASSKKMGKANYKISQAIEKLYQNLQSQKETEKEFKTQLSLGQPINPVKARKFIDDLTDYLETFANQIEIQLPNLAQHSEICFQSFSDAIKFKEAFSDEYKEGIIRTLRSLDDLLSYLTDSENAFYEMKAVIRQIPPFTPKLRSSTEHVTSILEYAVREYTALKIRVEKVREQTVDRFSVSSTKNSARETLMTKTSILFLAADPSNASRLRLSEEFREIQEKLRLAQLRERFKLELPQLSVRPTDIAQALLDTQPKIVHFSGHGTSAGALCFENQIGEFHLVQPDALAALFEQFANEVSCVLLNACYSETQARAIAEHIEYVIGMNKAIGDRAAIAFAIGFYQALGAGRSIEDAYRFGCVQIRLQNIPEHLTPVIIKKG